MGNIVAAIISATVIFGAGAYWQHTKNAEFLESLQKENQRVVDDLKKANEKAINDLVKRFQDGLTSYETSINEIKERYDQSIDQACRGKKPDVVKCGDLYQKRDAEIRGQGKKFADSSKKEV